jgi:hypothetical protein
MARFDLAVIVAVGSLAGCDAVFGLSGDVEPCEVGSFADVTAEDVIEAEDFSFDWDQTFGVIQTNGSMFELDPTTKALTPIELGPYSNVGLALTPEGNAMFYTIVVEPPELKGALRGGTADWRLDAGVPRGTFAGTPSADGFGPRRLMVKMRDGVDIAVQEYEDVNGRWTTVGTPREMSTQRAPNLTPNGLTMVYSGFTETGDAAVFAEQRESTSEAFGEPTQILSGMFLNVQLVGECARLYATDGTMLRRYDR